MVRGPRKVVLPVHPQRLLALTPVHPQCLLALTPVPVKSARNPRSQNQQLPPSASQTVARSLPLLHLCAGRHVELTPGSGLSLLRENTRHVSRMERKLPPLVLKRKLLQPQIASASSKPLKCTSSCFVTRLRRTRVQACRRGSVQAFELVGTSS